MTMRNTFLSLVALLTVSSLGLAQEARNGSAAASYLLIPQGARYLAGGGAAAQADGLESVFWNPAGLSRSEMPINAMFARRSYIADVSLNFAGASLAFEGFGSIAVTLRNFDIGEIPVTTVFEPDGTGEIYEPTVFIVGATYSRWLTDRTSFGVTANFLSERFTQVSATGTAFDIGIQYSSFLDVSGLSIGVVLKNLGLPMRYGGSGLWRQAQAVEGDRIVTWYKVEAAQFDLPSVIDLGTSYRMEMGEANSLDVGVTFQNNHSAQDEYRLGGAYNIGDVATIRASYLTSVDEGVLENIFGSYSFGGSLNLRAFADVDLSVDYGFVATEFFDNNQILALRFGF